MQKNFFFKYSFVGVLKINDENMQDPNPDPLVRGMDQRIRIHTKMAWIRNTGLMMTSGFILFLSYFLHHHGITVHC
jgi:hypothetical protein